MAGTRLGYEWGPYNAYVDELHPAALAALERGVEQYGAAWKEHMTWDGMLADAEHTIRVHAQCRISEALERLDYGDVQGFIDKLGSAVGYLANAIHKVQQYES